MISLDYCQLTAGYTLDMSPFHHRTEKQPHIHALTTTGSLKSLINTTCTSVEGGRKSEHQEGTHTIRA